MLNDVIHPEGAAIGLDGSCGDGDFAAATALDPDVPIVVTEIYPGWLRHWGENDWAPGDVSGYIKDYMEKKINFNFYVIHGGTSFAYTAGANTGSGDIIQPDLTSYDYGSPITEQGAADKIYPKYRDIIFAGRGITNPPPIPEPIKTIEISNIAVKRIGNVIGQTSIKEAVYANPMHFEEFGQNQGFIMYSTNVTKGGLLKFAFAHDVTQVFVNKKLIGTIDRLVTQDYSI